MTNYSNIHFGSIALKKPTDQTPESYESGVGFHFEICRKSRLRTDLPDI